MSPLPLAVVEEFQLFMALFHVCWKFLGTYNATHHVMMLLPMDRTINYLTCNGQLGRKLRLASEGNSWLYKQTGGVSRVLENKKDAK